jgi:hypothetical protein
MQKKTPDGTVLCATGCFLIPTITEVSESALMLVVDREEVVTEARSWRGTPYHLRGRVKGAGVDCATFPAEVLVASKLITREYMDELLKEAGFYGHDWFCHETSDPKRYLRLIMRFAKLLMEGAAYPSTHAEPGNLVLSKVVGSRNYNHSGIVTKWPRAMHCVEATGVDEIDVTTNPLWNPSQIAIFDPWGKPDAR